MQGLLSPVAMFLAADVVVQSVMAGLVGASVLVWAIWGAKAASHALLRRRLRSGLAMLTGQPGICAADLPATNLTGPVAGLVALAQAEVAASARLPAAGIKERTALALSRRETALIRAAQSGTAVIGSIGALAPFVGLFGTVWGIMHSFAGIAESGSSNLAVVAPGIAEALLATAIGLGAAIPAVIAFNHLARSDAMTRALLSDITALILTHLSRDLDRAERPFPQMHAAPQTHAAPILHVAE